MSNKSNPQTDIALIKQDIGYIKTSLGEVNINLKGLPLLFASKEELKDVAKETEIRLGVLESAIQGPKKYIGPIFAAICSSVVTFLVIAYLQKSGV